jgi:multidrug efflux pump subunit AcrA (membrane-fusion protein)
MLSLSKLARPTLLMAVLLAAGGGCSRTAEKAATPATAPIPPVIVVLAAAQTHPVVRTIAIVGSLHGDEEVTVAAKVAGRIVLVAKDAGDRAGFGETLAQIDPADYEIAVLQARMAVLEKLARLGLGEPPGAAFDVAKVPAVEQARLEAANAESRFRRAEAMMLEKPPVMNEQEFADLRTAYQVALNAREAHVLEAKAILAEVHSRQADLRLREHTLSETVVRTPLEREVAASVTASPQDGGLPRYGVAERMVSVGEYVAPGAKLFRLVADHPLEFRGGVPERFIERVHVEQTVRVRGAASATAIEGKISRVNPEVDPLTRTFEIAVLLPNETRALRPGGFARAEIVTGRDDLAVFAPEDAIVAFVGKKRVYTVEAGKAVEHVVTTGSRQGGLVEITEGLRAGALVVVSGATKLAPGAPVEVRTASDSAPPAVPVRSEKP